MSDTKNSNENQRSLISRFAPALIASLLPILTGAIVWVGTGQPERFLDEPYVLAFDVVWITLPFLALAALSFANKKVNRGFTAVVLPPLMLAIAGWAWVAVDGYRAQTGIGVDGANIWLGMIMLVLPYICLVIGLVVSLIVGRRK